MIILCLLDGEPDNYQWVQIPTYWPAAADRTERS